MPLEKVFTEIKSQTGYLFFYDGEILKNAKPVSVEVENVKLDVFLKDVLKDQSLDYSIKNKNDIY